jgi:hypothetical protein
MYKLAMLGIGCCVFAVGQTQIPDSRAVVQVTGQAGGFSSVAAPFVWGAVDTGAVVLNGSPVVGAPYTAQAVTVQTQVLADGNRIQEKSSTNIARDSQGRVRTERFLKGPSGAEDLPKLVTIEDPVSGNNYSLDVTNKIAFKMPQPPMKMLTNGPKGAALPGPPGAMTHIEVGGAPGPGLRISRDIIKPGDMTTTDLGAQTMEGVLVQGKRTTRTITAGTIGNDRDIVITSETWYSPDLQVLVSTKSEDPRIGETSYQLTNIQRVEPAASLFQVPADYTVKDQPGGNVFFHQRTDAK